MPQYLAFDETPFLSAKVATRTNEGESHFVVEASQLRLQPGIVPKRIETSLGNQQFLELQSHDDTVMEYKQQMGRVTVTVINT